MEDTGFTEEDWNFKAAPRLQLVSSRERNWTAGDRSGTCTEALSTLGISYQAYKVRLRVCVCFKVTI